MPIEKNELRRIMGHFATGVTIITSVRSSGELHGLTANAFTSVSLVPPLLLICVDKKAESYPCFSETRVFTVNILSSDQEALSRKFSVSGGNKFEGVSYRIGANGAPILDGTLAYIECAVSQEVDAGDHTLYLGDIQQAETPHEGKPLLFFRGGYREMGD
ncbi:MAG: flavin reductase family protein [Candidatus Binatus sp.]|uniref:flavin reductase family protein n=1 Tax=Candidatus Binatus sp. TaxID=2811406 RepID=UPI00271A8EE5|nr:flavin reductase family protein [Candidatus Binatus sp.]MDO8433248.1 flavin reductase family protein [Candidatus Binatus sp.]